MHYSSQGEHTCIFLYILHIPNIHVYSSQGEHTCIILHTVVSYSPHPYPEIGWRTRATIECRTYMYILHKVNIHALFYTLRSAIPLTLIQKLDGKPELQ
jgi:hypothetical protein